MQNLFIFTAEDKEARGHLGASIKHPVPSDLLDKTLQPEQAQYLKSLLPDSLVFYAWGAVPGVRNFPTWDSMQEGDFVLTVYDNHYHYISTVISKLHSRELAEQIWGVDANNNTWEFMYILTEPKEIDIHVESAPVVNYLYKTYRGFTKISDDRISRLQGAYGSLNSFLEQVLTISLPLSLAGQEIKKAENVEESKGFDPTNSVDERKKIYAEIVRRRGQPKFRKDLLTAYEGKCAVTECDVESVLEAAHIIPYLGDKTNHVTNGLLLRSDIHLLYDIDELKIDSEGFIHIKENLKNTYYSQFEGKKIQFPSNQNNLPNKVAMNKRFKSIY